MEKKKKNNYIVIIIITTLIIALLAILVLFFYQKDKKEKPDQTEKIESDNKPVYSAYRISGNSLEEFDLYFLKLENEMKNKVYSPLSIKYALSMLNEGANGETKQQISSIIGDYKAKKYPNNNNMSFANALFIKDNYQNMIKDEYKSALYTKYNAEIFYDSFQTPDTVNNWISNKTFQLIPNMFSNISEKDFLLVNALAIDMEWNKKIQAEMDGYHVHYDHEKYTYLILPLVLSDYHGLDFKDVAYKTKSAQIGASVNKYDIVKILGEDNIRATVGKEYEKWLAEGACGNPDAEPDTDTYLNQYIDELNSGYQQISSSTDFSFYSDDDVKVFAKELKEYDGTTLEYIGIMPKKDTLDHYIKNVKASDINALINKIKPIELENFKEGVITKVTGFIPMFQFDYSLNLTEDLNKLGITNVFDKSKADLSNLSSDFAFINDASHKANIEFSNDGIKAGAATILGGGGASGCQFEYLYDVPVEEINLTFDNPYMFFIMDKDTKEVWFTGTVYEPMKFEPQHISDY